MTPKKKTLTLISMVVLLGLPNSGLSQSATQNPAALVKELYKVHKNGLGPVFEGKNKRYLVKYFDMTLSDLIWKELTSKSDEVGNLDFDPLYNAQEIQIKNFQVAKPVGDNTKAEVLVSFNNFDRKEKIKFLMKNTKEGWKIENLVYGDGSDLVKMLSAPR